jgi:hypothetical protein
VSAAELETNSWAMRHRARRAAALVRAFKARGLTREDAYARSVEWWEELGREAGLGTPPSQFTIRRAQGLIEHPELAGLKFPTKGGTDE